VIKAGHEVITMHCSHIRKNWWN